MNRSSVTVDCPRSRVGRVIGRGGETIKALQQYTQAMIQIDQSVEPTKVTIAGSPQSLHLAVCMIQDIVAGNFKGFAMLRQLTYSAQNSAYDPVGQPQPVYMEGYGFVPPSQADMIRGQTAGGMQTLPAALGQLAPGLLQGQAPAFSNGLSLGSLLNSIQSPGMMVSDAMPLQQQAQGGSLASMKSSQVDSGSRLGSLSTESTTSSPGYFMGLNPLLQAGAGTPGQPHQQVGFGLGGPMGGAGSLPAGWLQMADPEGRPFFLNVQTGQSQWGAPLAL